MGLIAAAALAGAAYAIITKAEESDTRAGASRERVARLASRVDALESDVRDGASKATVTKLAAGQQELSSRLDDVASQAKATPAPTPDTSAVDQLSSDVQALGNSVKDIDARLQAVEEQNP